MELPGIWTGLCFYECLREFLPDDTLRLEITLCDDQGNLRGKAIEICEVTRARRGDILEYVQKHLYHVKGTFDGEEIHLEGKSEDGECYCRLEMKYIDDGDERIEGYLFGSQEDWDRQRVLLHRGTVRRDLAELDKKGVEFLKKIHSMGY